MCRFLLLLSVSTLLAAGPREETTRYQVNWPSGLSLGEGELRASRDNGQWNFELTLEAAVPGFKVIDKYRSTATEGLCSLRLEKESEHGTRKSKETTTFADGKATRETLNGGGKSEFETGPCPHDALAYLFHLRNELQRGRVAPAERIYLGSGYEARATFVRTEKVTVAEAPMELDHFKIAVKGAASRVEFDAFFTRDEARTLALVRVPFVMGTFSLEWVR